MQVQIESLIKIFAQGRYKWFGRMILVAGSLRAWN